MSFLTSLLLNAAVGFIQEFQAGSIVEELKKTLALKAVVLRNGSLIEIEAPGMSRNPQRSHIVTTLHLDV